MPRRVNAFEKLMRERNALLAEPSPDPAWLSTLEVQMAEAGRGRIGGARWRRWHPCPPCRRRANITDPFPGPTLSITGAMEDLVMQHPAVEAEDIYRSN